MFLGTLGFREGVSGVSRDADESLGILYVLLIIFGTLLLYQGADKSLARPGRKQATGTKLLQATQKNS